MARSLIWVQQTQEFFLNVFPGAAIALSLENLSLTYTGPVVRVRRSSDNTLSDFTAAQVINGQLATWVGAGNNGFVSIWYNQAGSSNATQNTNSAQPQIILNGNLITEGGKPALSFNGTTQRFNLPVTSFNLNNLSANIICRNADNSSAIRLAFANPDNASSQARLYLPYIGNNNILVSYNTLNPAFSFGASGFLLRSLYQLNAGSRVYASKNNNTLSDIASGNVSETGTNLSLGSYSRDGIIGNYWLGTMQEFIFYTTNRFSQQPAMAANINSRYSIY